MSTTFTSTVAETIDERLDDLEARLPALPAAALRVQRRLNERVVDALTGAACTWTQSVRTAGKTTATAIRTVTGTARWAGARTVDTAATAARTVAGQATAQGRIAREAVANEADELATSLRGAAESVREDATAALEAVEQVVDGETEPTMETYDDLTKAELYRRARQLDIEGRSQMTKTELIDALQAAA